MARIKDIDDGRKQLETLQKQQSQIEAQMRDMQKRDSAKARKQRNHALMVFGALVEKYLGNGNWRQVDPGELAGYLATYAGSKPARKCLLPDRPADEAAAAIRQWEKNGRTQREEDRAIVEKVLADMPAGEAEAASEAACRRPPDAAREQTKADEQTAGTLPEPAFEPDENDKAVMASWPDGDLETTRDAAAKLEAEFRDAGDAGRAAAMAAARMKVEWEMRRRSISYDRIETSADSDVAAPSLI